jgi:glycosyltransferase involved in cell wall biosynthesis
MVELATRLPRDRFTVEFVLPATRGVLAPVVEAAGCRVTALGAKRRSEAGGVEYVVSALRAGARYVPTMARGRFDIVDAWLFPSYALEGALHPFTRIPVFVAGRRSLSRYKRAFGPVRAGLDIIARHSADAIVANAYAVRDDVLRHERVSPARIRVIHNGVVIPPPLADDERERIRREWGIGSDELLVGAVANLKAGKGHDALVEVAAKTRDALPQARYRVVGSGPELAALQGAVDGAGLADRFRFLGGDPDGRALLGAFDVVVHPSEAEGLPNAVLEAAAAGRAILATDAGGTREIVESGATGVLTAIGDRDAIAAGLVRLGHDADLRLRLGAAARDHASRVFGMDRFVAETAAMYEELAIRKGIFRP